MKTVTRLLLALAALSADAGDASAPQGVTLSIYDAGYGVASENRRVNLTAGENEIRFPAVPARLDPATVSVAPIAAGGELRLMDVRFEHDAATADRLFSRFVGRTIRVQDGTSTREGRLLAPLRAGESFLLVADAEGAARALGLASVREVVFPGAADSALLDPALLWRVDAAQAGLQNLRLTYLAHGLEWTAHHEVLLASDGAKAAFDTRIRVANAAGGSYKDARIRLVTTAREAATDGVGGGDLRYRYGADNPVPAAQAAGLAPVSTYELGRALSLGDGQTVFAPFLAVRQLPVTRFYVYDGVKLDRFPRNRRTDWSFGTAHQKVVDAHLEFANAKEAGLGVDLPRGRLRVLQQRADGIIDFLGEDQLAPVAAGGLGQVRIGPARSLQGERERTGYSEIRPLHEYEETFEIRLTNLGEESVVIRVVEHLYRGGDYEIVKADAEYQKTGPQTIEFRPEVKPGGRRAIHYTVRYRW